MMEDVFHACQSDREGERVGIVYDSLGKTHKISNERMMRKWCEDGGKLWRQDSGNPVDSCPCCGLIKLFDKEPDYEDNRKYNSGVHTFYMSLVSQHAFSILYNTIVKTYCNNNIIIVSL